MEALLELFIVFALGWWVGWKMSAHTHLEGIRQLLRSLNISNDDLIRAVRRTAPPDWQEKLDVLEQQQPESLAVVEVKLEQHSGQIYAFRKSDDQFLGQGPDTDSLIARLNETMTPCRVVVSKEDGADLLQKNNT